MRSLKKCIAFVLAAVLVVAFCTTAWAQEESYSMYELAVTQYPLGGADINENPELNDGIPYVESDVAVGHPAHYFFNGGGWTSGGIIFSPTEELKVTQLGRTFVTAEAANKAGRWNTGSVPPNSGDHKIWIYEVNGIDAAVIEASSDAQVKEKINKDHVTKLAEVTVKMNWDTAEGGFNWAALETPVTLIPGKIYLVVSEENEGRGNDINRAAKWIDEDGNIFRHIKMFGCTLGDANDMISGTLAAKTGSFYGAPNFKYTLAAAQEANTETPADTAVTENETTSDASTEDQAQTETPATPETTETAATETSTTEDTEKTEAAQATDEKADTANPETGDAGIVVMVMAGIAAVGGALTIKKKK